MPIKSFYIVALNSSTDAFLDIFDTISEAAVWADKKGIADCHGHKAALQTIKTNISNCLHQPTVYKQFYGVKWLKVDKEKIANIVKEGT